MKIMFSIFSIFILRELRDQIQKKDQVSYTPKPRLNGGNPERWSK